MKPSLQQITFLLNENETAQKEKFISFWKQGAEINFIIRKVGKRGSRRLM